jgi:hypothetical protein
VCLHGTYHIGSPRPLPRENEGKRGKPFLLPSRERGLTREANFASLEGARANEGGRFGIPRGFEGPPEGMASRARSPIEHRKWSF